MFIVVQVCLREVVAQLLALRSGIVKGASIALDLVCMAVNHS